MLLPFWFPAYLNFVWVLVVFVFWLAIGIAMLLFSTAVAKDIDVLMIVSCVVGILGSFGMSPTKIKQHKVSTIAGIVVAIGCIGLLTSMTLMIRALNA